MSFIDLAKDYANQQAQSEPQKDPRLYDYSQQPKKDEELSNGDLAAEALYQVLNGVDWAQTRYIARHANPSTTQVPYGPANNNGKQPMQNQTNDLHEAESSWLIGKHPSQDQVNALMAGSAIAHPIISNLIPAGGWRNLFNTLTILDKANAIRGNVKAGIKTSF